MIVTTPGEVSLIDARKGVKMFREVRVPILGIVENMSYFEDATGEDADLRRRRRDEARSRKQRSLPRRTPHRPRVAACGDAGNADRPQVPRLPRREVLSRDLARTVAETASKAKGQALPEVRKL